VGHGRELELVREHRPVALQQVGDQVHPGGGVGHERDLGGIGADEARDAATDHVASLHPRLPVPVTAFLELAVEGADRLAHGPGRERGRRGVEVDLARGAREVAADVLPEGRHAGQG
jgi:hypothetical protein